MSKKHRGVINTKKYGCKGLLHFRRTVVLGRKFIEVRWAHFQRMLELLIPKFSYKEKRESLAIGMLAKVKKNIKGITSCICSVRTLQVDLWIKIRCCINRGTLS